MQRPSFFNAKQRRFRPNVAALVSYQGSYLGCRRTKDYAWQCVQGGLEPDDLSPVSGLVRELSEELGAPAEHFRILKQSQYWRRYIFPPNIAARPGMNFAGQEQLWFLVEIDSPGSINLEKSCGEFTDFQFGTLPELIKGYVFWKRIALLDFCREISLINE